MNDIYVTSEYPNPPIKYISLNQSCGIRVEEYTSRSIKEKIKNYFKKEKKAMSNKNFKIRDRVIVKEGVRPGKEYDGLYYGGGMVNYQGKRATIIGKSKTGNYTLDIANRWLWNDEMLEPCNEGSFTKEDLKDGMVVEYRCGWKELVLGEKTVDDTGSHSLCNFYYDLINKESRDSDIMRVYTINDDITSTGCIFDPAYLNCIWERKEEPKHKMKYKVGDRIKIREDLATGNFKIHVNPDMARMAGKVTTIEKCILSTFYLIDGGEGYAFSEDMIECIVDYEEMTVAEIENKLGYKVKIVDGE